MTSTHPSPASSGGLRYAVQDAMTLAGRNLRQTTRQPELLVFSTIQPVLFVLLFRYVFGGSINTAATGVNYVNYLMAGIFVQTTAFASTSTGVGLAEDLSKASSTASVPCRSPARPCWPDARWETWYAWSASCSSWPSWASRSACARNRSGGSWAPSP